MSEDNNFFEVLRVAKRDLDPGAVKRLIEFRSGYVVIRTLALAAANIAIWTAALTFPLWYLLIAFPLMVIVQQEMLIWVHEGTHRTLFRSAAFNDLWVGFWFASPLGVNFETYRRSHLTHHSHLASAEDGDRWTYELYIRGPAFKRVMVKAVIGYYGFSRAFRKYATGQYDPQNSDNTSPPTFQYLLFMLIWNAGFITACVLTGSWYDYLLLWILPLFSVAIPITIIRTIAEHQPMDYLGHDPIEPVTRTTLCSWLERRFMFPLNFNFHLEHHLFPQVPFFNLPRLHRELGKSKLFNLFPQVLQRSAIARVDAIWHGQPAAQPTKQLSE